jgi:hypothetical protein
MSDDESTELHTMATAAPRAITMPTTNMTVLLDIDPASVMSRHVGSARSHIRQPHITALMDAIQRDKGPYIMPVMGGGFWPRAGF